MVTIGTQNMYLIFSNLNYFSSFEYLIILIQNNHLNESFKSRNQIILIKIELRLAWTDGFELKHVNI